MSLAALAEDHGLHRVGARPPFFAYLKQAWQRRDFITAMAGYRLRADLEGNRLGILWLLLQPVLNAVIYGIIFGVLQSSATRGEDYAARVVIGVFLWQFFAKSLTQGAKSITGNQSLVQSLAFPRLTLPFMGHPPTWSWLGMLPLLFLFTLFNTGVALIAARLTVHVQDLSQLLPYLSRILFYTSGVLFDVSKIFKAHPAVMQLYDFYPLYQVLQMARSSLMGGFSYDPMYWLYFSIWSVVTFVVGLLFFWAAEERYGRD